MIKIQSPYKYVQGPDVLDSLGAYVKDIGKNFLILSGRSGMRLKRNNITASFAKEGISCTFEPFGGECTYDEIDRIASILKAGGYNGMIGLGGGKVIDTSKMASLRAGVPLVIAPTIASSDAPCSSLSIVYSAEGTVCGIEILPTNPYMVIVDSGLIAKAPVNMLLAGIGDALSTYFEARVCFENGYENTIGSNVSVTAYGLARLCYDTLLKDAYQAKLAVDQGIVTEPLEHIIEANTYLSGVGFESGGLSCAHAIQDALTAIPECHEFLHGYRVAFGTLCLLVLENRDSREISEVFDFCVQVGLPVTLKQLGLVEDVERKIRSIIPIAYSTNGVYHMPAGTTPDSIYTAILIADKIGTKYLE